MARTTRDILVYGRSVPEVMNEIMTWSNVHKMKIEENRGTYLRVRLPKSGMEWAASFVMETAKIVEIGVSQDPRGVLVHTEGYVKPPLGGEQEFSASAVMAGVPKRAGWGAMEDLWARLGTLLAIVPQQVPYAAQQPWPVSPPASAPPQPSPADRAMPVPQAQPGYGVPGPGHQPSVGPPQPATVGVQAQSFASPSQFCSSCGAAVDGSDKYCGKCGSAIL